MKINGSNQNTGNELKLNDMPLEIKKDEIYMVAIKEKQSHNQAVVQIRGKDMQVEFEGKMPQGQRVAVQVTGSNGKCLKVKTVAEPAKESQNEAEISHLLRRMGTAVTPELKQAAKILINEGMPLNREIIHDLRLFLEKMPGTIAEKLDALQAIANKRLDVSMNHLQAVYEALHGESLNTVIEDIAKELQSNRTGQNTQVLIEHLKQLQEILAAAPDLEKAIESIEQRIAAHDEMRGKMDIRIGQAVREAVHLKQTGQEAAAREHLLQALVQLEKALSGNRQIFGTEPLGDEQNKSLKTGEGKQIAGWGQEMAAGTAPIDKKILITEITAKLSNAAQQLREVKREITRTLDGMARMTQEAKVNVMPQVRDSLEKAIDLLDRAILKSDITLLTDMRTEKKLLLASSKLAEAKKLLEKGQNTQAAKLFNEVKASLEKLNWQPCKTKVMHYLTKEQFYKDQSPVPQKMVSQLKQLTHAVQPEPSARNTFEFMRSLGLNHESEAAQALSLGSKEDTQEMLQQNLKAIVMKLSGGEEGKSHQPAAGQQLEQVLNNLTGQQLLSKLDSGSVMQTMFFNLPVTLGGRVENVKLYINARKENEKIDWQNCSLYFLIDTQSIGETGILVSAAERNLSITLKNDHSDFKEKAEPLATRCREKLKEIGYNTTGIQFTKLNHEHKEAVQKEKGEPALIPAKTGMKGLDFKI